MTDERIRKGPSGPEIETFSPSASDANSIPVVNAAGDGFDMLAPGTDGQILTCRDGVFVVEDSFEDDPPALLVTIFGTNTWRAFSRSQIAASNDEEPRYLWTMTGAEGATYWQSIAIDPSGGMNYTSSGLAGLARSYPRNSGNVPRFRVAATPSGLASPGGAIVYAAQAPRSGLDPWTAFSINATGGRILRWPASAMEGLTEPSWATAVQFTGSSSCDDAAFDILGNLWVTDTSTTIGRFPIAQLSGGAGALTRDVILQGSNWTGSDQEGLALNSAGDLYVSRYGNADIRMLNAAGIAAIVGAGVSNPAPTAIITVNGVVPDRIRFDNAGNLWVADYDHARVVRVPAASLAASGAVDPDIILTGGGTLGNGGSTGPQGLSFFAGFGPVR